MEILPVSYIDIRLENEEPATFIEILKKCIKEAIKPGFKKMFVDDEKELLAKLARGLNMKVDEQTFITLAGDTHTKNEWNDE